MSTSRDVTPLPSSSNTCLLPHPNSYLGLQDIDMKPAISSYSYPMDISKFSPDSTSTSTNSSMNYQGVSSSTSNSFLPQSSGYSDNYYPSPVTGSFKRSVPGYYESMDNCFLFNTPSPPCIRYDHASYSQSTCLTLPPNS